MKNSLGPKPLAVPSPVWVIGSYGSDGRPNIMVASWGGICCTMPPCVAISIQTTRLTHANIMEHNAFTVNVPSKQHLAQTDYLGLVSGTDAEKFSVAGLTAVKGEHVDAPYVDEFPLIMECRLLYAMEIGTHTQFIGQIIDVKSEEGVLGENGLPVAGKIDPLIASSGDRAYYALGDCLGQAYAPGLELIDESEREQIRNKLQEMQA